MTNTQLWLSIGIPTFVVLVGILLNQLGQGRIETRLLSIESDLRRFYQFLGQHDEAISILKTKNGL
jgi:hypothetical protein